MSAHPGATMINIYLAVAIVMSPLTRSCRSLAAERFFSLTTVAIGGPAGRPCRFGRRGRRRGFRRARAAHLASSPVGGCAVAAIGMAVLINCSPFLLTRQALHLVTGPSENQPQPRIGPGLVD